MARPNLKPAVLTMAYLIALSSHGALEAQSHRLQPATGLAFVDAVVQRDVDGAFNPYVRQCLANLEVVDVSGTRIAISLSTDQVRVWPGGRPEAAVAPRRARVSVANIILIDLPPSADVKTWVVEVRDLVDAGGSSIGTLRTETLEVPEIALRECGAAASTRIAVLDRTDSDGGHVLTVDLARRVPFDTRGLWELRLEGAPQWNDEVVTLDSWRADTSVQWSLFRPSSRHWAALGGTLKLEANESLERIDWVLGATAKVRLDFLGIDELLAHVVTRFTPYPMLAVEYNRRVKTIRTPDNAVVAVEPDRAGGGDRLRGRIDWSVPLLFETTLNVNLHADYLFGELPPGSSDRWKTLVDVTVEYPVNAAGDVVLALTRLDGSTAPLYTDFASWMVGLAIRR